MWPLASALLAGTCVVSVEEIAGAIRALVTRARVVAEGAVVERVRELELPRHRGMTGPAPAALGLHERERAMRLERERLILRRRERPLEGGRALRERHADLAAGGQRL